MTKKLAVFAVFISNLFFFLIQGRSLENGEGFTPRTSPCQHCSCQRGNVICREMRCPVLDCPNPRVVQGQCCPQCTLALQQSKMLQILYFSDRIRERCRLIPSLFIDTFCQILDIIRSSCITRSSPITSTTCSCSAHLLLFWKRVLQLPSVNVSKSSDGLRPFEKSQHDT